MFVSFIRGINVGGHKKVEMKLLKVNLEALGYNQVKTHLNSGNVIFESDKSVSTVEEEIKSVILDKFGHHVDVFVLDKERLLDIISNYPYKVEEKNRYVTITSKDISGLDLSILNSHIKDEEVTTWQSYIFQYFPSGYGKTKLTNKKLEQVLAINATTRNMNTIEKLVKIMDTMTSD